MTPSIRLIKIMLSLIKKHKYHILILTSLFIWPPMVIAEEYYVAPTKIQAALFMKLLTFDKNLSKKENITIHIIGSSDFAAEIEKRVGSKIGSSTLSAITQGPDIPKQKPSVIYLGDASKLNEVLQYTSTNKILSITGMAELVPKGVSLGVGISVKDNKPKVLLNKNSSKNENIYWNPAILKIAKQF